MSNSNPWAPNSAALRDCSQGICSIYCPQWCYIIYSPPPPSIILGDDDNHSSSGFEFSPLVIAVIGILASSFILLIYYTVISRLCTRNSDNNNDQVDQLHHSELGQANSGLDETIIKSITVCKYEKRSGGGGDRGGGFVVEGSDCCVCLGEFQENESLRLLPKCNHAFHLPCIDTWLKSHSTCPLCRSTITLEAEAIPSSNSITINALEYQQRIRDQVVILQSFEQTCLQQQQLVVVELEGCDNNNNNNIG